ncbi:MAG: CRISPR-associated ring nuclease Csm6 [Hydrogenophilus thermoluteolus]
MPSQAPQAFSRRILLAVSGLTPQIVTETLYALIHQPQPFIPTEIHLITTVEGAKRARLALFSQEPGWFRRFCQDHALPPVDFDERSLHVLSHPSGQPLEDIRTPEDNRLAADQILAWVRTLTADPESALHVSIAGGRKTMGYYLGYALSLYGRPQDRLSHVLVSEPFESTWDFFYPTPYERIIQTRDGKLVDCRDATVTLAEIPFVRLRDGLPPRLLTGEAAMSEVVAAAERAQQPPRLVLDPEKRTAWADDLALDLTPTEFAVLYWLAQRARHGDPPIDWKTTEARDEYLNIAKTLFHPMSTEYQRIEEAFRYRNDGKLLAEYFQPHKSRINSAIAEALGSHAAKRYQIPPGSMNALPLEADQIAVVDHRTPSNPQACQPPITPSHSVTLSQSSEE